MEIVHGRQWFHHVDRQHDLLQRHGPEVLRRALEEGLKEQVFERLLRGALPASLARPKPFE